MNMMTEMQQRFISIYQVHKFVHNYNYFAKLNISRTLQN